MTFVGVINSSAILRAAKGAPDLKWACDLARMTQVSIVAYLVAGTFLSLSYWDVYLTILVVIAATRGIVAQALASDAPNGRKAAGWRSGIYIRRSVAARCRRRMSVRKPCSP